MTRERGFKDHFSGHAGDYARYRPDYPEPLFEWLAATAPGSRLAWDVGTGNGQAAVGLSRHFTEVYATDASPEQITRATAAEGVRYAVEPAEACSLSPGSTDLVTVGQALHWFDFDAFYTEVRRVLRPGGLVAAWTYELARVTDEIDRIVGAFFHDVVGPWWPPERAYVDAGYRDLPFPFGGVDVPEFSLQARMTMGAYLDYISTWSAVRRFRQDRGEDPLEWLAPRLEACWGEAEQVRTLVWPMAVRAGFTSS